MARKGGRSTPATAAARERASPRFHPPRPPETTAFSTSRAFNRLTDGRLEASVPRPRGRARAHEEARHTGRILARARPGGTRRRIGRGAA